MTPPGLSAEFIHVLEFAEARAYADLMRAAPREWNWQADESGTATVLIAPTLDIPLFNRVIGLGVRVPAGESAIESMLGNYTRAGVSNFAIQVCPAAKPRQLGTLLAANHLVVRDNWAKVYRSDAPVAEVPASLRIERIDTKNAERFAHLTIAAFRMPETLRPWLQATVGRPGWHHYMAWDSEEAVAAATMHVQGDVAWLGVAGTHPSHRRRGAQGALMAKRMQDGIAMGCKWFVTETGEDTPERPNSSYHTMLRNGFVLAYQRPNYMLPPGQK